MFAEAKDPLQEALTRRSSASLYRVAQSHSNFFKSTKKFNYEYFGMSILQRAIGFAICSIVGLFLFVTSLYRMILVPINPTGFVVPYVLSNVLFFIMFGFVSGFKTHFKKLFSKDKKIFTIAFIGITLLTLYFTFVLKGKIVMFFFGIVQIFSFIGFLVTFLPGGTTGLITLLNLAIKG